MYARKLKPEEQYLSRRNMAVAFEGEFDFEKELEKSKTEERDPQADHWGAFAGVPEDPIASLVMNKYQVRFDGHEVKLGGVGGVATLPACRRGGAIRACMEASFRELYDGGFLLSALYPFSTAYYRQFGFENGGITRGFTLPLRGLKTETVGGRVRQLFPGDDLSPLLQVYNAFYRDCNLSVVREVYDPGLEKENFLNQKRSVFVWEDEAGEPGAFLIGGRDGETLNCRTDFSAKNGLLFRDAQALRGLLAFVRKAFAANFETIYFTVPEFVNILSLLPEANSLECKQFPNGMLRVVNAEQALKLCRCRGEGQVVLKLEDPLLPENQDIFRLSFGPGRENRVERTTASPDAELPISDFSALLLGARGAEELPWMPAVKVLDPGAPLDKVFYRKPCHILDLF